MLSVVTSSKYNPTSQSLSVQLSHLFLLILLTLVVVVVVVGHLFVDDIKPRDLARENIKVRELLFSGKVADMMKQARKFAYFCAISSSSGRA